MQGEEKRILKKYNMGGGVRFEGYKIYKAEEYTEVMDYDDFVKKYGNEQLQHLKGEFKIFEDKGRIRKL